MTELSISFIAKVLKERIPKEERVIYLYRFFLIEKGLNEEFMEFCDEVNREERLMKSYSR